MKIVGAFLLLLLLSASSCKQDMDLTADYQETPVVYGLLNYAETTHYIRIQKGFLIDGNAYAATGVADSIYYTDSLTVTLIPFYNGSQSGQPILFHRIVMPKDSGLFASSNNILYTANGSLNPNKTYRLDVVNTTNDYTFSSMGTEGISLVNDFDIVVPTYRGFKMALQTTNPTRVVWYSAKNATMYDLRVRFPYKEYDLSTNALVADTFVDALMFSNRTASPGGGVSLYEDFVGAVLFKALHHAIPVNPNRYRVFNEQKGMTFYFSAGGTELASYLQMQSAQSIGISATQALPPYTNIKGGYGLFSSRYYKEMDSILLTPAAKDTLACNPIVSDLNFKKSDGQLCR